MGAAVIVIDPLGVGSDGNRRVVIGTINLSTTYTGGGDTYDPAQMGLQILDELQCTPAFNVGNGTSIDLVATVTPLVSTLAKTGFPAGQIVGQVGGQQVSNGDQSAFIARFVAYGT